MKIIIEDCKPGEEDQIIIRCKEMDKNLLKVTGVYLGVTRESNYRDKRAAEVMNMALRKINSNEIDN